MIGRVEDWRTLFKGLRHAADPLESFLGGSWGGLWKVLGESWGGLGGVLGGLGGVLEGSWRVLWGVDSFFDIFTNFDRVLERSWGGLEAPWRRSWGALEVLLRRLDRLGLVFWHS